MSSENSTERKLISFIAVNKKIPTEIKMSLLIFRAAFSRNLSFSVSLRF